MSIEPTFPDRVSIGPRRRLRGFVRRPGELVLAAADPRDPSPLDELIGEGSGGLGSVVEPLPRLAAFHAAGLRWVASAEGDDGLAERALGLEALDGVGSATPVYQPADDADNEAVVPVPGDLLARIAPARARQAIPEIEALGLVHLPEISDLLGDERHLFRVEEGRPRWDGFGLIDDVRRVTGVILAEHDWMRIETFTAVPNDPEFANQGSLTQIDVVEGWKALAVSQGLKDSQLATTGAPVVVIDTGFDLTHPDIAFDPDPTHHLDVEAFWTTGTLATSQTVGTSSFPHGTEVAGIIGALVDNATGIAGVAGGCGVIPVRLGASWTSGQVAVAVAWARSLNATVDARIRVVNLSLTTVETDTMHTRIGLAAGAGMVICAAAGNLPYGIGAGSVGFPASHPDVIGVGASEGAAARKVAAGYDDWQSRYGPGLDVVAPCDQIVTTVDGGGYGPFGGTSGAAPHVAGLAALILAKLPALSRVQVRQVIQSTCKKIGPDPYGPNPEIVFGPTWTPQVGCGLIDAGAALGQDPATSLAPAPAPVPEPDQCDRADLVSYVGLVGRAPDAGTLWRIYSSPSLTSWIEVDEDDIVETEDLGVVVRLRVRRGAPIRRAWTEALTAAPGLPAH